MDRRAEPTRTLARVAGPLMLLTGVAVALRRDKMLTVIEGFAADLALSFTTGVFTLMVGLIIIAVHQKWGGVTQVIVSLLGWLFVLRGAVLIFAPEDAAMLAREAVERGPAAIGIAGAAMALVGLYLTLIGYARKIVTL